MLTRRLILSGGLAALAAPALANLESSPRPLPRRGPPEPVRIGPATDALLAEARLGGAAGLILADARDGRVLLERAPDLALPPASVLKAVTASYALDAPGPGYRYPTRILGTGPMRDGTLDGDLILAGGGAPGLSSDGLAELVAQLAQVGLTGITGRFVFWEGALPEIEEIEPGQPDYLGYNPSVSGLNLNYNRVHFGWRRRGTGYETRMDARSESREPAVSRIGARLVDGAEPVYGHSIDAESGREVWSVARPALGGGGSRWLPVRESGAYAADVFRVLAAERGLRLPEATEVADLPEAIVLASLPSSTLAEIAEGMLRFSTNLTAEVLGLTATAARTGTMPETLVQSAEEMTVWARDTLGMTASSFVDHSGLSGENRSTAADLSGAMLRMGIEGPLRPLLRSYALSDDAGRPEPMVVQAKSGTLNFVSALAGYILPEGGPPMVFAIQTADLDRRAAVPVGDEDNPPGNAAWVGRARGLQFDLLRLWGRHAATDPTLQR